MKNNELFTKDGLFRIPMQFFAEGGDAAGADNADSGADNSNDTGGQDNGTDNKADDGKKTDTADLDKLVQARADKLTAKIGKELADTKKELEKLKKASMTAEEIKKLELSDKEKELAELAKELTDKENRLIAIKEIKEIGFDDVSGNTLELVDFVMGENEEAIKNKVKAFKELVDKFVKAEVDKTFKKNGRNPNGGSGNNGADDKDKGSNTIAEKLGKARAEKQKQSNDILKLYSGR